MKTYQTYNLESLFEIYQSKKINLRLIQDLKSGKDASVYLVEYLGKPAALKFYHNPNFQSFHRYLDYIDQETLPGSMRRAIKAKNDYGKKMVQLIRSNQEFKLLRNLYESEMNIPEPFAFTPESVLMEYLGEYKDVYKPAPKLSDIDLTAEEAQDCLNEIINSIEIMLENQIIHSDLSPYNILYWENLPFIIDFPQAVHTRSHLKVQELLERDINNVLDYFEDRVKFDRNEIVRGLVEML